MQGNLAALSGSEAERETHGAGRLLRDARSQKASEAVGRMRPWALRVCNSGLVLF